MVSVYSSGSWQYVKNEYGTFSVVKYLGTSEKVVIPSTANGIPVTVIGGKLFGSDTDVSYVSSVEIPPSVERICTRAFEGCRWLKRVTGCAGLKTIGKQAFLSCTALEHIPLENVVVIGEAAFSDCAKLNNITLKNVKSIERRAFYCCVSLNQITIPSCTQKLEAEAFGGCALLTSVFLPAKLYSADRISTTFGGTPFYSQTRMLTKGGAAGKLEKNESETVLTDDGFLLAENSDGTWSVKEYTGEEKSVDVVSKRNDGRVVTRILSGAFSGCPAIDVNIGEGITEIEDSAFSGNAAMLYADLPDSLQKLGADSFKDCKRLINVRLPERFNSPANISACFGGTPFLLARSGKPFDGKADTLIKSNGDGTWAIKKYIGHSMDVTLGHELPNGRRMTKILPQAFRCRQDIKSVDIREGYTEICPDAFLGCSTLTSVSLPDSITKIGEGAFRGCSALETLRIPEHLKDTEMLKKALSGTPAGAKLFSGSTKAEPYELTPADNGEYSLKRYRGAAGATVQSVVGNKKVTKILANAFEECNPVSVSIMDGYTEICTDAFANCGELKKAVIPESVTKLGIYAFRGCKALTDVTLPEHLKEPKMLAAAFKGTPFGESIKRDNSVAVTEQAELIANGDGTWSLAKYTDAGSVALIRAQQDGKRITRILGGAFAGRTDIVSVFIDEGITEILPNAFCGCSQLSFAALPKSLHELNGGSFGGCEGLARVLMPAELNNPDRIKAAFPEAPLGKNYNLEVLSFSAESGMVIISAEKQAVTALVLEDLIK